MSVKIHCPYLSYEKRWRWPPCACRHASAHNMLLAKTRDTSVGGMTLVTFVMASFSSVFVSCDFHCIPPCKLINKIKSRIEVGWSPAGSTRHGGHWLAYCTSPGWLWWWRIWWNEDWQGKPKYSEKTYPSATLSTTNPPWPDPGSNPGCRGGKPATNRLSCGAAHRGS
jgi:hypothetical protein